MNVVVFHPGTQHSAQTALALQQLGRLEWYATSLFYHPDRWPYKLERLPAPLGPRLRREFRRYAQPALDPALVRSHGVIEWLERIARRAGLPGLQHRLDQWGNRRFAASLGGAIRSPGPFALWGYNNSARTAFALAKKHGRTCILDRTIGDWRAYNREMALLRERYGDWFTEATRAVPDAVIANEAHEHELADRILVGSAFAARTVREFAETPAIASKLEVFEYCFDERLFAGMPAPAPVDRGKPVRFLFLGHAIPRKGIHHVLEAIARMPPSEAQLTIVGGIGVPAAVFARYAGRVTHREVVPRGEVPAIMAAHDVLLLPTYFEGSAITVYEALAAGMGLIQSDRTGIAVTPDTGILLDTLSTDALVAAMRVPIEDRDRLDLWRSRAQGVAERYSFSGYRSRIAALLDDLKL